MKKIITGIILLACTLIVNAGENAGFGYIKGLKIGDGNIDQISVFLESGFTNDDRNCNGVVNYRAADMSPERYNQITSVLLAASLAGKKVRLHSHFETGCNATFIALSIQDSLF